MNWYRIAQKKTPNLYFNMDERGPIPGLRAVEVACKLLEKPRVPPEIRIDRIEVPPVEGVMPTGKTVCGYTIWMEARL